MGKRVAARFDASAGARTRCQQTGRGMMLEYLVFALVAAVALLGALAVVLWPNLVHCVIWLTLVLVDTAVIYVALDAPFLGVLQIMLYTGGVITLMLFAIMLTRRKGGVAVSNDSDPSRRWLATLLSAGLFGLMAWAILMTPELGQATVKVQPSAKQLARAFLTEHVLSFEVLSILLLAATVGAIVLARRRDFEGNGPTSTERGQSV
jgi:NADH-quinone oxidoreductase subunit J